jgi:glycosyltransferase involved in cell wall biosynthesis
MKILYIGHYKENSGWSQAAIDYILSLDSIGLDVVCRNVKLTNVNPDIPHRIIQLEEKNLNNIDYCIQHVLPHHLVATQKFKKNVAYFVGETNTIKHLNWFEQLYNMDEVWVPNSSYKDILNRDGLNNVFCVPHTFDLSKYNKQYPTINFNEHNNKFKFYHIGDINDRKNIKSILKCYYSEFNHEDDVLLILKLRKFGLTSQQLNKYTQSIIDEIKKDLRIYKNITDYPNELIITSDFTEEQINAIHKTCDCFISISHGEAWSIPSFEAMCFGKTPICSNEGGPSEFIDSNNHSTGLLIDGVYETCMHSDPAFSDLFTGKEEWFCPSESLTKQAMRFVLEEKNKINRNDGIERGKQFSYNNIANLIRTRLYDK